MFRFTTYILGNHLLQCLWQEAICLCRSSSSLSHACLVPCKYVYVTWYMLNFFCLHLLSQCRYTYLWMALKICFVLWKCTKTCLPCNLIFGLVSHCFVRYDIIFTLSVLCPSVCLCLSICLLLYLQPIN